MNYLSVLLSWNLIFFTFHQIGPWKMTLGEIRINMTEITFKISLIHLSPMLEVNYLYLCLVQIESFMLFCCRSYSSLPCSSYDLILNLNPPQCFVYVTHLPLQRPACLFPKCHTLHCVSSWHVLGILSQIKWWGGCFPFKQIKIKNVSKTFSFTLEFGGAQSRLRW